MHISNFEGASKIVQIHHKHENLAFKSDTGKCILDFSSIPCIRNMAIKSSPSIEAIAEKLIFDINNTTTMETWLFFTRRFLILFIGLFLRFSVGDGDVGDKVLLAIL